MAVPGRKASDDEQKKEMERLKKENDRLGKDNVYLRDQLTGYQTDLPAAFKDAHRPTKLAEQYSELYDDEWTDAFYSLREAGYSETECISTLLSTLRDVFEFCKLKHECLMKSTVSTINCLLKDDIPIQREENLKDKWKPKSKKHEEVKPKAETEAQKQQFVIGYMMSSVVGQVYMQANWDDEKYIQELKPFIKECIKMCWLMVIHSPPLCLSSDPDKRSPFDATLYRPYIASGKRIEYVVWPALQLHYDGPRLCKGVAQGGNT